MRMYDEYAHNHALSDPYGYYFLADDTFVFHFEESFNRPYGESLQD